MEVSNEYDWIFNSCDNLCDNLEMKSGPLCRIDEPDFLKLLSVLRFWKIRYFSEELLDELKKFKNINIPKILDETIPDDKERIFFYKICIFIAHYHVKGPLCDAALGGHLDIVRYLFKRGYKIENCFLEMTAYEGHLDVIKFFMAQGIPLDMEAVYSAARGGRLECLKFFAENGCVLNERTFFYAVGHLDVMEYLLNEGCPWDETAILEAARSGDLECLKFLHRNGYPLQLKEIMRNACYSNNPKCLEYLLEIGAPIPSDIFEHAVLANSLELCEILHKRNISIPDNIFYYCRSIKIAKFLVEKGKQITCQQIYRNSLFNDNVELFKYIHQTGFQWDEDIVNSAKNFRRVKILNYISESSLK